MRKALVFLLLFGGGLAVLWLVAQLRDIGDELPEPPPFESTEDDGPIVTVPGDDEDGPAYGATLKGELHVFERTPDGNTRYDVHAADVENLEADLHRLIAVVARTYDTETEAQVAELNAESALARIQVPGKEGGSTSLQERAELFDVVFTIFQDAPFTPLVLRVSQIEADFRNGYFESGEPVTVEGSGMNASSNGVVVEEERDTVRLLQQGEIDLWIDERTRAVLSATGDGPIELRRTVEEDGTVTALIEAGGGALLVIEGRAPVRVESQRLVIRGSATQRGGEAERFVMSDALAEGAVVLRQGTDTFRGERARFGFDEDGRVSFADLEGEPSASVWVESDLDARQERGRLRVDLSGAGPLVVRFRPRQGFTLAGPGQVAIEELDLRIDASQRISGQAQEDRSRASVQLLGDVRTRVEGFTFEGASLDLRVATDEEGHTLVRGRTLDPARMSGNEAGGRPIELLTDGELRILASKGSIEVPLAHDARGKVGGEDGFSVEMGVVRDLVWKEWTFEAGQGVRYGSELGVATADAAVGRGREHLELHGTPDEPATFRLGERFLGEVDAGSLRAQHILWLGDRLRARDGVSASLRGSEGTQVVECSWAELRVPEGLPEEGSTEPRALELEARDVRRALLRGDFGSAGVRCNELFVKGRGMETPDGTAIFELDVVDARGDVRIDYERDGRYHGEGEHFEWRADGRGRLESIPGGRVELHGRLAQGDLPYELTAAWITLDEQGSLEALEPELSLELGRAELLELLAEHEERGDTAPVLTKAAAAWMGADLAGVLFSGSAHLEGRVDPAREWTLDSHAVHVSFHARDEEQEGSEGPRRQGPAPAGESSAPGAGLVRELVAWDGFEARVGEDLAAFGDILEADFRTLRMEGDPARLELLGFQWESPSIEYDLVDTLVQTEQGTVVAGVGTELEGWRIEYESLRPFEDPDSAILVLRNPRFIGDEGREVRASWALFWIDRDQWTNRTEGWLGESPPSPELRTENPRRRPSDEPEETPQEGEEEPFVTPSLFGRFESGRISHLLTEVYVEGDVEYLENGDRKARLEAVYIDMIDGHGWLKDAEILIDLKVRNETERIVARADWLRHSADGSLRADSAVITSCLYDDPHFVVQTKDLRLVPSQVKETPWRISMRKNSLRFRNGFSIPLPPIKQQAIDEEGKPSFENLSFGNTARFGTVLRATFNRDLGPVEGAVATAFGADREQVSGRWRFDASYLGSRGVLFDVGVETRLADRFWSKLYFGGIDDDAEDRGLVRTLPDMRSSFRSFVRGRARYTFDPDEWIDVAFSRQSDEGVQAEFWERDFLNYEERDTYLHWRRAQDQHYWSANASYRVNDFRTYVEEQPALGYFRGLTPISSVAGLPLLYTAGVDLAHVWRRIGESSITSPFDPVYADGLGSREVLRASTDHRLELAGQGDGWSATPFTELKGAVWDEGMDPSQSPARAALIAGVDLATSFHRTYDSGLVHGVTPRVGVHGDVESLDENGTPVPIDEVEDPYDGLFVDVGLRSRWFRADSPYRFEIDLRATHASDRPTGDSDGWLPLAVLSQLLTEVKDTPVAMIHDGRYDTETGDTVYSRTLVGWEPWERLGLEFGYHRGLTDARARLFDAASVAARWSASDIWDVEGRQIVNLANEDNLNTSLLLRRRGHDLIFEIEFSQRSGEGGSSVNFNFRPVIGWRRPDLGLLDRWLGERHRTNYYD